MEKKSIKSKKEHDIIKIIEKCAKCNVHKIKVGDIEIEFNKSEQEKPKVIKAISEDPEFNEDAKKHKKEIEDFHDGIREENEVLLDFDAHEEKAIRQAMGDK